MEIKFIWDDSFTVGRPDIDGQHKRMFNLANALPERLNVVMARRAVMAFYKYTREHFSAEEQMMKEIGYPNLEEHHRLHEELITELGRVGDNSFRDENAYTAFKQFLFTWVTEHIMKRDKDYFRFCREKGIQPA